MTATGLRHRFPVAVGVGVVVGAVSVSVALALGSGGGDRHAQPVRSSAPSSTAPIGAGPRPTALPLSQPELPTELAVAPNAKDLLALIERAASSTYHARYSSKSASYDIVFELWHKPPLARRDLLVTTGAGKVDSREIKLSDHAVRCQQPNGGVWLCVNGANDPSNDPSDVTFGTLNDLLQGSTLTPRDDTIAGRPARCLDVAKTGQPARSICVAGDTGVPLLIDTGDGRISLLAIDQVIPDGVFAPPVPPVSA